MKKILFAISIQLSAISFGYCQVPNVIKTKLANGLFDRLVRGYYNGQVEEFFAAFLRYRGGELSEEEMSSIRKQLDELETRTLQGAGV